ncbi:gfo/Idh/MocA family oxidoreductase [Paenibacillus oralis]|uniref:Gfo/Idh/MocA family oxidoreductase n=1 Tax=Paenibacillus oralis TaxID=2490856 RepID=A0A3P3U3J9_9BACL|nr:Gfo/Idh/MocA family oxidoreductase [Paenibacillus oralis]RRJ64118.1 gfo/Idh/MocA family oxidoreductase [Paenibacillus oralis]
MREQTGAAIVGCGTIFPVHAGAVSRMEAAGLKLVVDTDGRKAEQAAAEYGCEAATDYRAILEREDIQVVHLCTPHHLHAEMAVALLQAGKHVLCEKPMAHNLQAAERLLKTAQDTPAQLGIVFQNRYNAISQKIREVIDSGALGKLLGMKGIVTWHRGRDYYAGSPWRGRWETEGGGVLINQAIHTLDLLQWFGGEITSVQGNVTTGILADTIEVEDTAHAGIAFKDGAWAIFYATNAYVTNSPVELELVFEAGTLYQRDDHLYLKQNGAETRLDEPASSYNANTVPGKAYWGGSHELLISDFYDHVREGRKFWIDEAEGIKSLRIISELYRLSKTQELR